MQRILLSLLTLVLTTVAAAQPRYNVKKLAVEKLDRGVVAVRQADGKVFVSWRILSSDRKGEAFNVFRSSLSDRMQGKSGVKLNDKPLTKGGSFFIDEDPLAEDAVYEVCGGDSHGAFLLKGDATDYLSIPLCKPEGGKVPSLQQPQGKSRRDRRPRWRDTGEYTYTANDATVADVDGDGQYEIILKWDPTNSRDNSHDGYTGNTLIDCYRLDGSLLWRIDLGRNIRSGAHYVQFIAYDLDGDGRAELMMKTADGTIDGKGQAIGDPAADYRNPKGRILEGPEYITVFNGLTGEAMDTKPYIPERGRVSAWGDDRGNRSERYLAGVGYFGGRTPSAVFCRGYYTRTVIATWDWDGHELKNRWTFDTNMPQWKSYAGQGNHNLRIADVDGDGWDEITYGSMAVDHDGRGLYNTGFGHGDAIHLVPDPKNGKLYIWDCHENKRDGSDLRDAATGKVIFQIKSRTDVGRAMAADIDPTNPGLEMWSTDSHGIRNMKGKGLTPDPSPTGEGSKSLTPNPSPDGEGSRYSQVQNNDGEGGMYSQVQNNGTELTTPLASGRGAGGEAPLSVNFGIWWDGDLLRELLDHETVTKYNWKEKTIDLVKRFDGMFNNGTKSNPCLAADILGDWREEVIIRNRESTELRIYTTTIPTDYRMDCLMQDIPYRISVATQNIGYNQPSEPGRYIGPDKTDYLK